MAQTITNVSPSSGPTAGGTPITITGSGFVTDTATGATVGGNALANFAVVDDSTITGNTPAGVVGAADVVVTLTGGTGSVTDTGGFTYVAAPTVASVTPNGGPPGGGTGVTITGSNFDNSATVSFGTALGTGVNFVSSSEVTATSPAHGFGVVDVTVTTTAGGQSATSAADHFTYATAPGAPTGVSATAGDASASVSWTAPASNGSPISDYSVRSSPATTTQHAGTSTNINFTGLTDGTSYTFTVVATNGFGDGPQSAASNSVTPTAGGPTVTSVSPNGGPPGGGTFVTITGTNFDNSATVSFGTAAGTGVNFVSSSEVTVTSPAHAFGIVDVTVTTSGGGTSGTSAADQFTYATAPGAPTGVSATAGNGSASVNWTSAPSNGSPISDYAVSSSPATTTQHAGTSTSISFSGLTNGISYTFTVVATNGFGSGPQSAASNSVTPNAGAPTVTSVSPNVGPIAGGTPVTIVGANFDSSATVSFGSAAATGVTFVSSSEVKATSPAGAAGAVNVTVTTSGGGTSGVNSADQFTYVAGPTVTSVSPDIGPPTGGTPVTITGAGFTGTTSVFFGATSAAFSVTDASHISATSPSGTAGVVTVTVTTPGGTASNSFTYAGVPTVTALSPNGGPPTGNIPVTITGTSFIGPTCQTAGQTGCLTVHFGPALGINPIINSSMSITVTSPATFPPGTFGVVEVTVTTAFGTSAFNPPGDQFTYALLPGAPQSVSALPGRQEAIVRWNAAAPNGSTISSYTVTTITQTAGATVPPSMTGIVPTTACPTTYTCAVTISGLCGPLDPLGQCTSASYAFTVQAFNGFGSTTSSPTAAVLVQPPGTTCTSIFLTPSLLSPEVRGTTVTFTAQALGCTNPVYEFWLLYPNKAVLLQQVWGTGTWTWNTGSYPVGAYQLRLGANASGDQRASFEGKLSFPFTLVAGCTGAGISSSPPSPEAAGTKVTFTATSQACLNPQYQFWWQKQGTSTWSIGQPFGSTSTWTWDTTHLDPGGYTVIVWANQLGTPVSTFQTYAVRTIALTGCYPVSLSATPSSLQHAGSTVLLTAQAGACGNPMYAFWVLSPGASAWTILATYSTTSTLTWSSPAVVGGYHFMVWALDTNSGGVAGNGGGRWDSYTSIAYRLTPPNTCTSVTFTTSPSGSAVSGTPVNITASAAGCSTTPLYQFWILKPGGAWTDVQQYSTANTYAWSTAGLVGGSYNLAVWVRDETSVPGVFSGSLGSWDALASSPYMLTSTPCTSVGASSSPAGTAAVGTPVTISGVNPVGCPNPIYEIWMLAPGAGSWSLVESYPGASSFPWNTTGKARGVYQFSIWVRDTSSIGTSGNSLGRWDAYATVTYTLT